MGPDDTLSPVKVTYLQPVKIFLSDIELHKWSFLPVVKSSVCCFRCTKDTKLSLSRIGRVSNHCHLESLNNTQQGIQTCIFPALCRTLGSKDGWKRQFIRLPLFVFSPIFLHYGGLTRSFLNYRNILSARSASLSLDASLCSLFIHFPSISNIPFRLRRHRLVSWPICCFCWCSRRSVCVFLGSPLKSVILWQRGWFVFAPVMFVCAALCERGGRRSGKTDYDVPGTCLGSCTHVSVWQVISRSAFEYSHAESDSMRRLYITNHLRARRHGLTQRACGGLHPSIQRRN